MTRRAKIKPSSETCLLPQREDQLSKLSGGKSSGAWRRHHGSSQLEPESSQKQFLQPLAALSVNKVSRTRLVQHAGVCGNQLRSTSHVAFKD